MAINEMHSIINKLQNIKSEIASIPKIEIIGKITAIKGLMLECDGISGYLSVGSKVAIHNTNSKIICEVVAFENNRAILLPFSDISGVGIGAIVKLFANENVAYPDESWLGRVINAFGKPIDDMGPIKKGSIPYPLKNPPPNPQKRNRVEKKIDLGVRAIDAFASCCYGQRMGIFAGSGVGKSVLISMLTKYANVDVKIIGLVGERGREVQEFIQEYLGEEGLKSAIVIVATGDESALMRKQAAYLTITIAEYFRDLGKEVLCIIDSITRFAMAQREIGLSAGEPPSSKGYTPTVFSELPKLLERAGPGIGKGNITGLFTVLVEGDDQNEPISDAVRGILDGHIVLDRAIAERGRFPAVNVLKSVSRTIPKCNNELENQIIIYGRKILANYEDMAEMIRIGAYQKGSNIETDMAIGFYPQLESFLSQKPEEHMHMADSYRLLAQILGIKMAD
jgi:flagellum-specific ATP synthase